MSISNLLRFSTAGKLYSAAIGFKFGINPIFKSPIDRNWLSLTGIFAFF